MTQVEEHAFIGPLFNGPRGDDLEDVKALLRALVGEQYSPADVVAFVHGGPPISKARARWSKAGTYTPKRTTDAQKSVAKAFMASLGGRQLTAGVAIVACFYRQNRQWVDLDNLSKLVLDAGTQAKAWIDDSQVAAYTGLMHFDPDRPRTVIALCEFRSTITDARKPLEVVCDYCRKLFPRRLYKSTPRNYGRFCSSTCARAATRAEATCPHCNTSFQRTYAAQRYCSPSCAQTERFNRLPNGEQRPPAVCEKCGSKVSRREYKRCRKCFTDEERTS